MLPGKSKPLSGSSGVMRKYHAPFQKEPTPVMGLAYLAVEPLVGEW